MNRQNAKDAKPRGSERSEPCARIDACAHAVIGAAIEVHRELGPGFLENVYEQAMLIELSMRGLSVRRQVRIPVAYKGRQLPAAQLDLLVNDELVVELKAVDRLAPIHVAQLLSYLKSGAFQLGLLINFNVQLVPQGIRRVIWSG